MKDDNVIFKSKEYPLIPTERNVYEPVPYVFIFDTQAEYDNLSNDLKHWARLVVVAGKIVKNRYQSL